MPLPVYTLTEISEVLVSANNTHQTISFSSIPSTFTDLLLRCHFPRAVISELSQQNNGVFWMNGDTTDSNYDNNMWTDGDLALYSGVYLAGASYFPMETARTGSDDWARQSEEIWFPRYAGDQFKWWYSDYQHARNYTTLYRNYKFSGMWRSTSAINSITIGFRASPNQWFRAGAYFRLMGVTYE